MGGVAAVHVERRVGLGVPESLSLGEGVRVADAALGHGRQDEVARAVQDALDGRHLVGREAFRQGTDDRDAAGNARFKSDDALGAPGRLEHFRPMSGEQGFVGRDDVLAGRQGVEHDLFSETGAAEQFDDDVNLRVVDRGRDVGRDQLARHGRPCLRKVADDDMLQVDGPARPEGDAVRVPQEQSRHAAADGPAADHRNVQRVGHVARSSWGSGRKEGLI